MKYMDYFLYAHTVSDRKVLTNFSNYAKLVSSLRYTQKKDTFPQLMHGL